jgi:drug/metabolite transporter (DMT)-like permease
MPALHSAPRLMRQPPAITSHTPKTMPAITTSCSLIYILLMIPAAAVVAVDPARNDMVAVLGAMFAAAIVVFDFQAKAPSHRKLNQFVPVFIASAFVGSVGPGATIHTFFPEYGERLSWHGWAVLGFLFSLAGWVVVKYALQLFTKRLPDVIDNLLPKWASRDGDTKKLDP